MTRSTTAAAALGAHARVRTRKLNTRTNLAILRQEDLQDLDDEAQRNVPRIDTGIEKAEESVRVPILLNLSVLLRSLSCRLLRRF